MPARRIVCAMALAALPACGLAPGGEFSTGGGTGSGGSANGGAGGTSAGGYAGTGGAGAAAGAAGTGGASGGAAGTGGTSGAGGTGNAGGASGAGGGGGTGAGGSGGTGGGGTGGVGGAGGAGGGGGTGGGTTLPSCNALYGSLAGALQVCDATAAQCTLAVDTDPNDGDAGQTCGALCAGGGGECLKAFDNGAGQCVLDTTDPRPCTDATMSEGICVCSRGCGSGPPCSGGKKCKAGTCA
ncbi:MAG: hypothetical protein IT377_29145 [Polyangiaceae bacterium]|nr:hypothetical protein [Polyangiaceae bacterium]